LTGSISSQRSRRRFGHNPLRADQAARCFSDRAPMLATQATHRPAAGADSWLVAWNIGQRALHTQQHTGWAPVRGRE
jgi:hypothetical protein